MILKNAEDEIIGDTTNWKKLSLYDPVASLIIKTKIIVNGKEMTVKEFKELKNMGVK